MLENGDQIGVSQCDASWVVRQSLGASWDVNVCQDKDESLYIRARTFVNIPVKTPFAINLAQIEYCKGAINPETNNYELKVRFCSGYELWLGGEAAVGLLEQIGRAGSKRYESPELAMKFKEKTK